MWRRLVWLAVLTLASTTVGIAASANVSSVSIGAATVAVPRCTTTGLTVMQNLTTGTVSSVTVGSISSACAGGTLLVTVNNGTTTGSGSATVPAGGGSVAVTLGVAPAVTASEQTDLVLVGP